MRDYGVDDDATVDYPDWAEVLSRDVSRGQLDFGIAICGTGMGMAIVANKFSNVRAVSIWNEQTCRLSRTHNDANVLCLGARVIDHNQAVAWTKIWLNTPFSGDERHRRRVGKIKTLEAKKT